LADLSGYETDTDPVFHLTHGLFDSQINFSRLIEDAAPEQREALQQFAQSRETVDWREYSTRRFAIFSQTERAAIIRYLEYRAQDEYQAWQIDQAIESYWRPSAR
jgi:hypothetical protein